MKHRGFTVLEILVAISIVTIAVTMVTFSFSKLNSRQALDKSTALVVSTLNEARSMTLSSVGGSQYGVNLQNSQLVLFKGTIYSSSDPNNIINTLNSLVDIRNITLTGGGTNVVFKRLTGYTDQTGTLELFLKADPTNYKVITIGSTGLTESN